jgi:uncharacterized protein DUF5063
MRTKQPARSLAALTRGFRLRARAFCELIEGHQRYPVRRFLNLVHHSLPALYAAGLELPNLTPSRKPSYARVSIEEWQPLFRALGKRLGNRTWYSEIFDPYDRHVRGSLIGNLADDLSDICRDLTNGSRCWQSGDLETAVWEWRYGLEIHWGEHATGAMRALHWLKLNHDFGPPPAMPNNWLKLSARRRVGRRQRRRRRAAA